MAAAATQPTDAARRRAADIGSVVAAGFIAPRGDGMSKKPKPPTFHLPIGPTRDTDGEVVMWSYPEQDAEFPAWVMRMMHHPDIAAAGAFVIIGPTQVQHADVRTRLVTISHPKDTGWKPAALSDFDARFR
jgi:hypothetical protein